MNFFVPKDYARIMISREFMNITDFILLKAIPVSFFKTNNFVELQVLPVIKFSFNILPR